MECEYFDSEGFLLGRGVIMESASEIRDPVIEKFDDMEMVKNDYGGGKIFRHRTDMRWQSGQCKLVRSRLIVKLAALPSCRVRTYG